MLEELPITGSPIFRRKKWYVIYLLVYYRPQKKFGKVLFLQVSVCLSTWGGGCVVAPRRGHAWVLRGACVVARGGHVWGGMHSCSWGGVCGCSRGACMVSPGGCMGYEEIRRYDQWAGGTHPTGMHSCFKKMKFRTRGIREPMAVSFETFRASDAPGVCISPEDLTSHNKCHTVYINLGKLSAL